MTETELERILDRLQNRRMFDEIFVLILERQNGELKLVDYGMREIGDIAAWIAVEKEKQNPSTQGERA